MFGSGWLVCRAPRTVNGFHVRCGRCLGCDNCRRLEYRLAAEAEALVADRTWFGTFTKREDGLDFGRELQLYLKRIRKAGLSVRYLAVQEFGKRGTHREHWHMLLHCVGEPTRRQIEAAGKWDKGFFAWKLADRDAVRYVCKYVTKGNARPRTSQGYGLKWLVGEPMVQRCLDLFPGATIGGVRSMSDGAAVRLPLLRLRRLNARLSRGVPSVYSDGELEYRNSPERFLANSVPV